MKLTNNQQWALINRFIEVKKKQGCKVIIKQSLPEKGVWIDDSFFSVKFLVKNINSAYNKNYEV